MPDTTRTMSADRQRQLIALRLASPMRPAADRTAAPVDGLGLFDQDRSPALF